ncbi:hypothetical protein BBP40_007401 [Aspergillus hancockii]|nr:hypothetical protein BBP40_007401 [Aspergillus hancockii]
MADERTDDHEKSASPSGQFEELSSPQDQQEDKPERSSTEPPEESSSQMSSSLDTDEILQDTVVSVRNILLRELKAQQEEKGPTYTLDGTKGLGKMADVIKSSVIHVIYRVSIANTIRSMRFLCLEQNEIDTRDAILARTQANEAAGQGKILMIVTIVTTVFNPMSFLSSIIVLNVTSFQHDQQGNLLYGSGWIVPRITIVVLAIAMRTEERWKAFPKLINCLVKRLTKDNNVTHQVGKEPDTKTGSRISMAIWNQGE